jgi:T-complex protein 1 subunit delta
MLVLEEAERSLHDALCVIRCLVKRKSLPYPKTLADIFRALIAGGGAPEIEVAQALSKYSRTVSGTEAICFQAFADALEVIPTTLAENAGLNPIKIVTELRHRHEMGEKTAGVNVRKGTVTNILEENVIQPLLVTTSALELSAESLKMILKVDDIAISR